MRILCGLLTIAVAAAAAAPPTQDKVVKGSVAKNAARMPVVDAIGVWNAGRTTLLLYLFPSAFEPGDIDKLRKDTAFVVALGKKSPDLAKWQWCPYAQVNLKLDPEGKGPSSIKEYLYVFYGLEKDVWTDNMRVRDPAGRKEFKEFALSWDAAKGTGTVDLTFAGSGKIGGHPFSWDLQVRCPVVASVDK